MALPGVIDPDGELRSAGFDRRGGGESEHLAVVLPMAGVAGDQGQVAMGAGEDVVQVALWEDGQGMVEALATGFRAAAVEQLQQRLAVPGRRSAEMTQVSCWGGVAAWSASVWARVYAVGT